MLEREQGQGQGRGFETKSHLLMGDGSVMNLKEIRNQGQIYLFHWILLYSPGGYTHGDFAFVIPGPGDALNELLFH